MKLLVLFVCSEYAICCLVLALVFINKIGLPNLRVYIGLQDDESTNEKFARIVASKANIHKTP